MALPSFQMMAHTDPLNRRVVEQMLVGVTTRQDGRSLEPLGDGLTSRGTSKSAVSRRFVVQTAAQLERWRSRSLADLDLVALLIDGLHVSDHCLVAAPVGRARRLEGAAQSGAAAVGRGRPHSTLRRAQNAERARSSSRAAVRLGPGRLGRAYGSADVPKARRFLHDLARRLEDGYPSAAESIREGLDETLTVLALHLSDRLQRSLTTTNAIESLMSRTRHIKHNVKRWRNGKMIVRWVAVVAEAEPHRLRHLGADLVAPTVPAA